MSPDTYRCGICGKELKTLGSHYSNVHETYYIKGKSSTAYVEKPRQKPTAEQLTEQDSSEEGHPFNIPVHALRAKNFEEGDRRGRAVLSFQIERTKLASVDPDIVAASNIFDPTKPKHKVIPWDAETLAKFKTEKKASVLRQLALEDV